MTNFVINFSVIDIDKKNVVTVRHLIDTANFKHILTAFADKMTPEEIDDMFSEFEFDDDGMTLTKSVVSLSVTCNRLKQANWTHVTVAVQLSR